MDIIFDNAAKPVNPAFHLFESMGHHVLIPDGSRIYKIDKNIHQQLKDLLAKDDQTGIDEWLMENNLQSLGNIDDLPVTDPPLTSISLAIAQKCNLGCSYCYAQEGGFGVKAKNMPLEMAIAAVDLLFAQNLTAHKMNSAFLGGEPLTNREALQAVTRYAKERAEAESKRINFSITTNGTLLTEDDADF